MFSQISAKFNRLNKKPNTLASNENLAIPSKLSLNFLMMYPPINSPAAIVGMVMIPKKKKKTKKSNYINMIYAEIFFHI